MTYSNKTLKQAVTGTNDYHEFMRTVTVTALKSYAGYKPDNTGDIEKVYPNWINWQSREMNMGIGVLWIFYAVENGHFTTHEAKLIWRYGQALKFPQAVKYRMPEIGNNVRLMEIIEDCIKNPRKFTDGFGEIYYGLRDEFGLQNVERTTRFWTADTHIHNDGTILIKGDVYDIIVRLFDNLIMWIYTGSQYIDNNERKELFKFMGW